MTEAEWLTCTDPGPMLEYLKGRASERKLRLFGVACCRLVWHLLDEIGKKAVECAERMADGQTTADEHEQMENLSWWGADGLNYEDDPIWLAGWAAHGTLTESPAKAGLLTARAVPAEGHQLSQARLLRDIIGNPFRPVILDPRWLQWNDSTVVKLAESIYHDRAFDRMPILADALEDARCSDPDILGHCREPGEHYRGCWLIDLLTGRE